MTGDNHESTNEHGALRKEPDAIAEARTRMLCSAAILPLAVVLATLFTPTMTFFHESGFPVFLLPLPLAFIWPLPVYLAAGAFCVEIITTRHGTRSRVNRLLNVLLLISIITNSLISVVILIVVFKAEGAPAAVPFSVSPGLGLVAFLRARRHQGMRRVAFVLLSYSLSTGPFGVVLAMLMNDQHTPLHWGGYITFVALILVFLISLLAVIPPGPPDDYKGKEL